MDLSTVDTKQISNEGRKMEVMGPDGLSLFKDGGKTPITITLLGQDADAFQARVNAVGDRRIMQTQRKAKITKAVMDADNNKVLAHATVAWDGIEVEGESLECNFENALALYTRFAWLAEQVDTFVTTRANFLKASQTI